MPLALVSAGPEHPALPALGAACGCRLWAGGRMSCPCWGGLLRLLPRHRGVSAVATGQRPPVLICPGTLDKVFPEFPVGGAALRVDVCIFSRFLVPHGGGSPRG